MKSLSVGRVATIQGEMRPPSDKSLTHRAYMLAATASGESLVRMPLRGEDCESTLRCLCQMGLTAQWSEETVVRLTPAEEWHSPTADLDCGNSGTTMRLLSGLIASRPIRARLVGDASLSRRPMSRIATPLRQMGAEVAGDTPPLEVTGGQLKGIEYVSPVASGQIKSCVLLAGLRADGPTSVMEPSQSRDHTERMLKALGAPLTTNAAGVVRLERAATLPGFEFEVPGDLSSAAFFMVAAACMPEGRLVLRDVGLNPSRTGILEVFKQCGIGLEHGDERLELGEPIADLEIRGGAPLKPFEIVGPLVPRLIDEIPVLAILATQCEGTSRIRGARELRVKESDRIEAIANGLRLMGARVETFDDGIDVSGPVRLRAAEIDAHGDHRIAMAFAIAGLLADGMTVVHGAEAIDTSYPGFEKEIWRMCIV